MIIISTFACSDIHGNITLFNKILEFLKPDDTVYFLGDAADRGKDGWEIIKNIYNDSRFVYLKGNHEDMLVKAMREFVEEEGYSHSALNLLKYNGGKHTYNAWRGDGTSRSWIHRLEFLPTIADYVNKNKTHFIMTHAGYTPYMNKQIPDDDIILWDRLHFLDAWDSNINDNIIILHGHTPTIYIADKLNDPNETIKMEPYWYCNNKKVCIDLMTYVTETIMLFDLDTLEHHLFKMD